MIAAALIVACTIAGVATARFLFRKDTEKETRRRNAFKLAATMRGMGLDKIPSMLENYAVGDYSGIYAQLKEWVQLAAMDEELVLKEFDRVFSNVLEAKLKSFDGRAWLAAKLDQAGGDDPLVD